MLLAYLFVRRPVEQQVEQILVRRALLLRHRRMRPVRRPQHALGRLLHQRLGQAADVLVLRRAGLRGLVRRGELHPAAAGIDKIQQRTKLLRVGRNRLQKLAGVVDDELARQALDLRLVLRQLAAVELDVGVPAEGMHLRHHRVHDVEAEHAAVQRHDAHRADAGLGQALELGRRRARPHHRDALGVLAELLHRREGDAVVVAVGVGLHHDHALEAEALLQLPVHRHGEVARHCGVPGAALDVAVVEVHVRVGARRRVPSVFISSSFLLRRRAPDSAPPRRLQKTPPWCGLRDQVARSASRAASTSAA